MYPEAESVPWYWRSLDFEQNERIVRHIEAGGLSLGLKAGRVRTAGLANFRPQISTMRASLAGQ